MKLKTKIKQNKKTFIIIGIIVITIFLASLIFTKGFGNKSLSISGSSDIVKYVVPHLASIKCEVVDKVSLNYNLPISGIWISKTDIGFKSKVVNDISYSVPYTFWESLGKDIRVKTQICDSNKQNCQAVNYNSNFLQLPGTIKINFNSIDVTQNSLFIALEYRSIGTLLQWKPTNGGLLTYSAEKYGLTIYSTTTGFGGTICSTGCDLNCPAQSVRSKLVYDTKTSLNFYETTNYLEFWDQPALVGTQYGGTIWNPSTREFCFGGYIYSAGNLQMQDGTNYVYPQTYNRKVDCCSGATISLTNGGSQICTNGMWQIINPQTPPECLSDVNCPNQGRTTCNVQSGGYYTSGWSCQNSKCVQSSANQVQCCPTNLGCAIDMTCSPEQGYKCVGGNIYTPPANLTGNYTATIPNCASCDEFAKSYILSGLFPETKCESPKILGINTMGGLTCVFSFIKIISVAIVFIFASLFGIGFFDDILKNSIKKKKIRKLIAIISSVVLAFLLSLLTFFVFVAGVIVFMVYLIIKFAIGFFLKR